MGISFLVRSILLQVGRDFCIRSFFSLCLLVSSDRLPSGSPGVFISGAEMEKANEAAGVADVKAQENAADVLPADQGIAAGTILTATDATATAPAVGNGAADSLGETVEHPLDIISEIEHLLRIVGNVAVHEFRRIAERLADLKNHPAIKPGE